MLTRTARWRAVMVLWVTIGYGLSVIEVPSLFSGVEEARVIAWVLLGVVGIILGRRTMARIVVTSIAIGLLVERIIPLLIVAFSGERPDAWFSALIWVSIGLSVLFAAIPARTEAA